MYTKTFEIRWSDLDPNRHVANSTYADLLSETRFSMLREKGFSQKDFETHHVGPVVFSEEFHYLREVMPSETIQVGIELLANSLDFKYGKFAHYLFNEKKKLSLYSVSFFGWFDLNTRKLCIPPEGIIKVVSSMDKAEQYEELPNSLVLKNPSIPYHKTLE